jgi:hypothetical protein
MSRSLDKDHTIGSNNRKYPLTISPWLSSLFGKETHFHTPATSSTAASIAASTSTTEMRIKVTMTMKIAAISALWLLIATLLSSCLASAAIETTDGITAAETADINNSNRNIRGSLNKEEEDDSTRKLFIPAFDPAGSRFYARRDFQPRQSDLSCDECDSSFAGQSVVGDSREDIFNQLSTDEYNALVEFAISRGLAEGTLDGVNSADDTLNSNYIVFVQLHDPPKLEALDYLDGITSVPPRRYGIVTIHRGAERPRDVMVRIKR